MRLGRFAALAFAMAITAPQTLGASPLNWPSGDRDMAVHCAAVLSAYGQAYELAADLTGRAGTLPVGDLPSDLVQLAGGEAGLPVIAERAAGFQSHAESVARTSFYPQLIGDGTPYLADDGRELVVAVQACAERYGL